jgi:hypothetical protein
VSYCFTFMSHMSLFMSQHGVPDTFLRESCESKFILQSVMVAERSKAYADFARSEAGIMGSNPTQGMDVWCLCVCVCVCVCVRFSMFVYS